MARLVRFCLLAAALAGAAACTLALGVWRPNHPDPARFERWGVDVSHHNGEIDWPTVARQPRLDFAWIKATEGGDWVDPRFHENWVSARAAGLKVGAYHFFTFCRPGAEQARHFLATVPEAPDALPPALDVEYGGNCRLQPGADAVRRELRAWLDAVERGTGRRPIIYATADAHAELIDGAFEHPLWIRSIWTQPPQRGWAYWQFWSRGHLDGIDGYVDLNVAR